MELSGARSSGGIVAERTVVTRIPVLRRWNLSPRESAILAGILLVTIAVYLPSLRNGWVFDDWEIFVNNKLIHSWSFIWNSFIHDKFWFRDPVLLVPQSQYYRPVENTFIAANALLFGTHIVAWHLLKIGLHIVAVVLCFRVAQLLSGNVAVGLLTAAIFGVIPAHVDGVVWLSAISEPLSTALELGALLCFINRKPGWSRGMLSALALYACAQLTHESAIFFPVIVSLYVFLFEGGDEQSGGPAEAVWTKRHIASALRACSPFVVVTIAYLCARVNALGLDFAFTRPESVAHVAIHGWHWPIPHFRPVDYLLTLPVVLLADLGVLAVPGVAGPVHDVDWITSASPIAFVSAGAFAILAAVALVLARRSYDRRIYLFCAAWSLLSLAPAMKLTAIWALVQDRYLYTPSFGWSLALALVAVRLAAASPRARAAVGTAMALVLAAYMVTTIQIKHYWHDDVTFFEQCVAVDPYHLDYRIKLAGVMNRTRDFNGAVRVLQEGTAIDPDDAPLQLMLAQQYQRMGRQLDFEREFQKYIKLSKAMVQRRLAAESSDASQPASKP